MIEVFPAVCSVLARGPVAQLGARFHGMEEVVGSIPTRSTNPPLQFSGNVRIRADGAASWPSDRNDRDQRLAAGKFLIAKSCCFPAIDIFSVFRPACRATLG